MNNRIQELAEQAGLLGPSSRGGNAHEAAEKFAALIIAECAKACEPRPWVGLTDEWVTNAGAVGRRDLLVARAIEAKLKELNHD
jgi:hypothetical protein